MALNRLRQKYAAGVAQVKASFITSRGDSVSWSVPINDLGETKSFLDEATVQEFRRPTRSGEIVIQKLKSLDKRNAANFRPVRIASIIKGNSVYNGSCKATFSVPGYYPLCKVEGPVAALASLTQANCPHLPLITSTVFPTMTQHRALYCLQQAANKASEPVHEFGVTLGELAETISMLTSPLRTISKLSKKMGLLDGTFVRRTSLKDLVFIPSKRVKRFARKTGMQKVMSGALAGGYVVNQASDFWLTWRFGIQPGINEIGDIMKLDYSSLDNSGIQLARKRVADEWTIRTASTGGSLGNYFYYACEDNVRSRGMSSATYAYSVKHGTDLWEFLNSSGLSLRHLPQVMWELVPCSFVLDRFVDVGAFIRSLTPDPNVKTIDTCISEKVEVILDRRISSLYRLNRPLANLKFTDNKKFRVWNFRYARDVGVAVPRHPLLNPKLLKIAQNIDHATLLWQRLPKWR